MCPIKNANGGDWRKKDKHGNRIAGEAGENRQFFAKKYYLACAQCCQGNTASFLYTTWLFLLVGACCFGGFFFGADLEFSGQLGDGLARAKEILPARP